MARAADVGLPSSVSPTGGRRLPGGGQPAHWGWQALRLRGELSHLGSVTSASADGGPSSLAGGESFCWGSSLECRNALCDSHGRGPKATSGQMGNSAFLYELENLPFCMNMKIL